MSDEDDGASQQPVPAIAVSPVDATPDRTQSDADNEQAVTSRADNRRQSDKNQLETMKMLRELAGLAEKAIGATNDSARVNESLALAMVAHQERAKLAKRRYIATLIAIAIGFSILGWRQQDSNDASTNARKLIVDCVVPSTDPATCYARGQAQTAKILGDFIQVIGLAAACAPDYVGLPLPARIVAIEHCILSKHG